MVREDYAVHKFELYFREMWARSFDNVYTVSTGSQYRSLDISEIYEFNKEIVNRDLVRALFSSMNRHLASGGGGLEQ